MAAPRGWWDNTAVPAGWFDETLQPAGWFDPDGLDTSDVAEGSGQVTGVGVLTGAGQASEGSGSVSGVGALSGAGQEAEGSGSVIGIGVLQGEGSVPAEGGGSISGVGFLSGTGETATQTQTARTGGGSSNRKKKWPKKVMVRGQMFTVRNWEEELSLLQAALDRAQYQAAVTPSIELEKPIPRLLKRLKKVESERDRWLKRLKQADEELIFLLH